NLLLVVQFINVYLAEVVPIVSPDINYVVLVFDKSILGQYRRGQFDPHAIDDGQVRHAAAGGDFHVKAGADAAKQQTQEQDRRDQSHETDTTRTDGGQFLIGTEA